MAVKLALTIQQVTHVKGIIGVTSDKEAREEVFSVCVTGESVADVIRDAHNHLDCVDEENPHQVTDEWAIAEVTRIALINEGRDQLIEALTRRGVRVTLDDQFEVTSVATDGGYVDLPPSDLNPETGRKLEDEEDDEESGVRYSIFQKSSVMEPDLGVVLFGVWDLDNHEPAKEYVSREWDNSANAGMFVDILNGDRDNNGMIDMRTDAETIADEDAHLAREELGIRRQDTLAGKNE